MHEESDLTKFSLFVPQNMLDGKHDISSISSYINDYFYKKFAKKYNLSVVTLEKLIGHNSCIPKNLYLKIYHPDNTNLENNFLIDVYSGILDFALSLEHCPSLQPHQKANLFFSLTISLNFEKWQEDILLILKNNPDLSIKMHELLSSSLIKFAIHSGSSFCLFDVNTDNEEYSLIKPLQDTLLHTYLNSRSENNQQIMALSLQKSFNPSKNYSHLISKLNSFFNFDCSTLFNQYQRINNNEVRLHLDLPLNTTFFEFINNFQKLILIFNGIDFNKNNFYPEQKILHGSKISLFSPNHTQEFSDFHFQLILKVEHEDPSTALAISEHISLFFSDFCFIARSKTQNKERVLTDNNPTPVSIQYFLLSIQYFFDELACQNIRTSMLNHKLIDIKPTFRAKVKL